MPVLQHQLSHARRRPYSKSVPDPAGAERQSEISTDACAAQVPMTERKTDRLTVLQQQMLPKPPPARKQN
jgi:hypothetical protein